MLQASESHAGANLILGNLGLRLILDPTAWISSNCVCFLGLVYRCLICVDRALPMSRYLRSATHFCSMNLNPFWELNFRPQTHEKSVRFSLIVIPFSFSVSCRSFRLDPSSSLPFGGSEAFFCLFCLKLLTMISGLLARWDHLSFPRPPVFPGVNWSVPSCHSVCSWKSTDNQ